MKVKVEVRVHILEYCLYIPHLINWTFCDQTLHVSVPSPGGMFYAALGLLSFLKVLRLQLGFNQLTTLEGLASMHLQTFCGHTWYLGVLFITRQSAKKKKKGHVGHCKCLDAQGK